MRRTRDAGNSRQVAGDGDGRRRGGDAAGGRGDDGRGGDGGGRLPGHRGRHRPRVPAEHGRRLDLHRLGQWRA
ncbi:MAG: hypothetical protein CVT84_07455 [Alphaproteobacteria bacterium HGW-Alphaproteobacteria-6]|nr:MAG: hypothetical protein CVT84_07455 [Alphaproteobacteria bacterium HGW-Alphaproteobacteria-6]